MVWLVRYCCLLPNKFQHPKHFQTCKKMDTLRIPANKFWVWIMSAPSNLHPTDHMRCSRRLNRIRRSRSDVFSTWCILHRIHARRQALVSLIAKQHQPDKRSKTPMETRNRRVMLKQLFVNSNLWPKPTQMIATPNGCPCLVAVGWLFPIPHPAARILGWLVWSREFHKRCVNCERGLSEFVIFCGKQ